MKLIMIEQNLFYKFQHKRTKFNFVPFNQFSEATLDMNIRSLPNLEMSITNRKTLALSDVESCYHIVRCVLCLDWAQRRLSHFDIPLFLWTRNTIASGKRLWVTEVRASDPLDGTTVGVFSSKLSR